PRLFREHGSPSSAPSRSPRRGVGALRATGAPAVKGALGRSLSPRLCRRVTAPRPRSSLWRKGRRTCTRTCRRSCSPTPQKPSMMQHFR
ncbi:unnamed protein product, partial [Symbiodinium sp. CCMP2456]